MIPTELKRTVIIADDHSVVRAGLRDVLESLPDVEVVAEAANGLEAISQGKAHRPHLMTLDAGMPLSSGMEVYGELRRWSPKTSIAVVTGFTAAGLLSDWIDAGVEGLFLKSCDPAVMRTGLATILNGSGYVDPDVLTILEGRGETESLTLRERQILHLIAAGNNNAQIAERLSISPKTVDNHRTRMMAKLDVHSLAQLIAYALREGLLDNVTQS